MTTYMVETAKAGEFHGVAKTGLSLDNAKALAKALTRGNWEAAYFPETVATHKPLLVNPDPNAYTVQAFTVYWFLPSGEIHTTKTGEKREVMIRMSMQRIHIKCNRSGMTWYYTGMGPKHKKRYSDSRVKGKNVRCSEFNAELARMMGDTTHVWAMLFDKDRTIKLSEYKAIMGLDTEE